VHPGFPSIHPIAALITGIMACLLCLVLCTPSPRYVTAHSYPSFDPAPSPSPALSIDTAQPVAAAPAQSPPDSVPLAPEKPAPDTATPQSSWERVFDKPAAQTGPDTAASGVVERGVAAWYGPGFDRKKTASGERFDARKFTAAHKTLPFNTMVKVTNLENGISVVVRINDRGPFNKNRIIDLSAAAARTIGLDKTGTANVTVETLPGKSP
jgi:rare lipoprotein A